MFFRHTVLKTGPVSKSGFAHTMLRGKWTFLRLIVTKLKVRTATANIYAFHVPVIAQHGVFKMPGKVNGKLGAEIKGVQQGVQIGEKRLLLR